MQGLIAWLTQYGQVVAFFAQLLYWLVIAAAAVYAVMLLKRFVDNACGIPPKSARTAEDQGVSVEEFTD
ncbi:MAG TPA: hypothetical protein VGK50_00415 [Coriobacteriia bacterium]|jgi:hypothetical protein